MSQRESRGIAHTRESVPEVCACCRKRCCHLRRLAQVRGTQRVARRRHHARLRIHAHTRCRCRRRRCVRIRARVRAAAASRQQRQQRRRARQHRRLARRRLRTHQALTSAQSCMRVCVYARCASAFRSRASGKSISMYRAGETPAAARLKKLVSKPAPRQMTCGAGSGGACTREATVRVGTWDAVRSGVCARACLGGGARSGVAPAARNCSMSCRMALKRA
jgi:hypothetical protein